MYKLCQTPTASDNLLIPKTFFSSGINYKSYNIEARTVFFIFAFRISYSTNIVECILRLWKVMENMRRLLEINMD